MAAPESECSPSAPAFSSTPTFSSEPSAFASLASSIAQDSPAGPAPTMTTSSSILSPAPSEPSCTMSRSSGSAGWYSAGTNCSVLRAPSAMQLPNLVGELWHDLEEIPDHAVISHLEDGSVLILVDRDDDLGRAHPGQMLDGAGDTYRDVERRTDRLARLSDLIGVGAPPGIHHRARRTDSCPTPKRARQVLEHLEIRGVLQPS